MVATQVPCKSRSCDRRSACHVPHQVGTLAGRLTPHTERAGYDLVSDNLDPAALAVAAQNRLAQRDFAVSVGEGRERSRRLEVASLDVLVNGAEELLERVREALVVSAGIVSEATHALAQEGGIAQQLLVGPVAVSQP